MIPSRRLHRQRGASLISLLVLAIVVGFIILMGMRVFPSVNEYFTIRKAVSRIMHSGPSSPADIRNQFEKTIEIEYSIKSITANDLVITPVGDSGFVTSFAYNVEVPIADPVFLLMKYDYSASSKGP